ncbi:MAG: hypothetical protein HRT90_08055 [Candidatus Margulisbacteria bacterium]|nr:hypothetical protein [Candidatus Margulisiibacteriota bacterium]
MKYSEDIETRLLVTTLLERQRNFTLAEKHWKIYTRLVKKDEKSRLALYQVEIARADKKGDFKTRKGHYLKALKLDPKCAPAYTMLARLYRSENKPQKVLDTWSEFLDHIPERFSWIYSDLEEYLYEINRYHELIGIYQKLIRQPGSHRYIAHLALLKQYLKVGQKKEAIAIFNKIKDEKPNKSDSLKEFMRYSLQTQNNDSDLSEFNSMMSSISNLLQYSCKECGTESGTPEWYCGTCGAWESYSM